MDSNEKNTPMSKDPLEALMEQQAAISKGEKPMTALDELKAVEKEKNAEKPNATDNNSLASEVDYGDDDLAAEIAAEDKAAADERARKAAELREKLDAEDAARPMMAPDEHDMKYHDEAMDFQSSKLNIVTGMVNRVVAKYRIISGGIPNDPVEDKETHQILSYGKTPVMGELIDIYHKNGEKITPDFEQIILRNWIMPDGTRAIDNLNENNIVIDKTMFTNKPEDKPETITNEIKGENNKPAENKHTEEVVVPKPVQPPTINISVDKEVQSKNPININIDKDIAATVKTTNEVNVVVKEVSNDILKKTTIYRNSERTGIINTYDTGINDVDVTLPLSGYRCTMRSVNWYDFISLASPNAQNGVEAEIKKWSVIYKHLKNPSIGEFESFEDFLKKTKYLDRELLLWALLVATSDEEETITVPCDNPNCDHKITFKYRPRTITKTDKSLEPTWYERAKTVSPGDEAKKVWEEANAKKTMYQLPHSKIYVELSESSAYDFINKKLGLVNDLYKRYRPNDKNAAGLANIEEDLSMVEFDYLVANALYVESLTIIDCDEHGEPIIDENGNYTGYTYDKWDKIEEIITNCLDGHDSAVLLKLIQESQEKASPISFRVENVVCPVCGKVREYIPIDDIGTTLLFQLSRRFGDIKINLSKTGLN